MTSVSTKTFNRTIWDRIFDESARSRDFLKAEWDAFRKTLPEEKAKKRRWLSSSKNEPTADSKAKSLEVTSLTDLENTIRGCEGDWKNQNGGLGHTVSPLRHH